MNGLNDHQYEQNDLHAQYEQVVLLECNLDDMTGEAAAYALERTIAAGALDAWLTPIQMKKGRPGVLFSVLCLPEDASRLRELLLTETTTLGVRWRACDRQVAERRADRVQTRWGPVRRKLKILGGEIAAIKPEYEDCARLAQEHGVSLHQVQEAARHQPHEQGDAEAD